MVTGWRYGQMEPVNSLEGGNVQTIVLYINNGGTVEHIKKGRVFLGGGIVEQHTSAQTIDSY